MLSITSLTNQEQTVYTVPSGKNAMIFVDIFPLSTTASATIKVNNTVYCTDTLYGMLTAKMALNAGDVLKVGTSGTVNVFVHGIETGA